MRADVAIIIVTYNSQNEIGSCLRSVLDECREVRQQIIVLDNSPNDDTASIVRDQFPDVQLILPKCNLGFAAGVNEAARFADAEFILLLNPDTVIKNHAVDTVVEFARSYPDHRYYGGRTLKQDGTLEPSSCWGLPSLWSMTMFATGLSTLFPNSAVFHPEGLGRWKRDTVREVGVITGCFLLIPSATWRKLRGFDERFFMYGEDIDLALRARSLGCRPVICPDAELVHEVGKSSSTPAEKMVLLYRGKITLINTHWRWFKKTLGAGCLILGVWMRSVLTRLVLLLRRSASDRWMVVWQQRDKWISGYPEKQVRLAASPATASSAQGR